MDAWSRQPDESDPAWGAFVVYRDMGAERSLAKAARSLGKSATLVEGWSSRHSWLARVAEFDRYVDGQAVDEHVERIREMNRRQASVARLALSKAVDWLHKLNPEQLRDDVGVRLLDVASKLERLAEGANTEELGVTAEVQVSGRTLAELFVLGDGASELDAARWVVERASRPRDEPPTDVTPVRPAPLVDAPAEPADATDVAQPPPLHVAHVRRRNGHGRR